MTAYFLEFELAEGADAAAVAEELKNGLASLDVVDEAEVQPEDSRAIPVGEIAALLAGTVILVEGATRLANSSADLIAALTKVVNRIRELVESSRGLARAVVEVNGRRVPVEALTEEDIRELAES